MLDILIVAVLVCALAVLMLFLPAWRRAMGGGHSLPVWAFLSRRGGADALAGRAALQAEMRCTLCGAKAQCFERLKAGAAPLENCPNAALLVKPEGCA